MLFKKAKSRRSQQNRFRRVFLEHLEDRRLLTGDFGDAPAPYPVTLQEDGAHHQTSGPQLGSSRDAELDGTHSVAADADGSDDGVTFGTIQVGQLDNTVTVNVQNAPSGAKIDAWIDFNQDGNWGGAKEKIASSVAVINGSNTIQFHVPANSESGETFARFRISTAGGLGIGGPAADGEVEDYVLTVTSPRATPRLFQIRETNLTGSVDEIWRMATGDMDGDGDVDLVATSGYGRDCFMDVPCPPQTISWYENDGNQSFTKHNVVTIPLADLGDVITVDLNSDGHLDIVFIEGGGLTAFYNDGAGNFTENVLYSPGSRVSVASGDVDGDGDQDLMAVTTAFWGSRSVWLHENIGGGEFSTTAVINLPSGGNVKLADFDRDGDLDAVTNQGLHGLSWHENIGGGQFTSHVITTVGDKVTAVEVGDIDGNGTVDFVSQTQNDRKLTWHKNDGQGNFTSILIDNNTLGTYEAEVLIADFNGDGIVDVSANSKNDDGLLKRFIYTRNSDDTFTRSALHQNTPTETNLGFISQVADIDQDGDIDLFSRSSNNTLIWFENLNNFPPTIDAVANVTIVEDASEQTVNLAGITAAVGETQPLRVTASSNNTNLIPSPAVAYTSDETTGSIQFTPIADATGSAVITVSVEDGGSDGDLSTSGDNATTSQTFTITVNPINDLPTLASLSNLAIDEDAPEQTVNLAGITAGGGENQPLRVTAISSNASLIANPTVVYSSAAATGTLKFTPLADQSGSAVITVTVEDGGLDNNLATTGDNLTTTQIFDVTVNSVNDLPTLAAISDLTIDEDAPEQTVNLAGITAGGGENQPLRVTASSDNTNLVLDPSVTYTSDEITGSIKFTPITNASGSAVITVIVEDGGPDGDLATTGDNAATSQTFTLTVNAVNDLPTLAGISDLAIDEDASEQTVILSGITAGGGETQPLRVTASSDNTNLVLDPTVTYTSDETSGSIKFTPITDASSNAVITVTVTDGGLDGDLSTSGDNATTSQTFTLIVNALNDLPTLAAISNLAIDEDASEQTVILSGITAGGGENQPLRVTATSDNADLIANPTVVYTSAESTGSLSFAPLADEHGTSTITVTVEDGGPDNDLATTGDNATTFQTFTLTVKSVNDLPTLAAISNLAIDEDAAEQTVNLAGITSGGGETQPLRVTATSSNTDLIANPTVLYSSDDATGSLKLTPLADQNGTTTITVTVTDGGLDNDLATNGDNATTFQTFTLTVNSVNDLPTLAALSDLTFDEDATEQTVNLSGITSGGGETQPLRVTATSSNTDLIANPSVIYTSAESTGSIKFTPLPDANGSAVITVTVEDGGLDNDLATTADNATITQTFDVTVNSVNDNPTLNQLDDLNIDEDASEQTVDLTGITAGGGESQPLRVTATSSNTDLIANPTVVYTSAESTGSLSFAPLADEHGTSTITVTVEDGGLDGDLGTTSDNATKSETFTVTVSPVNDDPTLAALANLTFDEDTPEQTVNLAGITAGGGENQPLRVTAVSSNASLIANPTVVYSSAAATGSLKFTPLADQEGTTTITVTVTDGGLDNDLSTSADNLTTTQTFDVTVNPVNDVPTLGALSDVTMDEDASQQTVNLSGITAGGGETQPLRVTATSSNTDLIANPTVVYSSAAATGTLKFTPLADQSGSAIITVTVEDGGLDNNLATTADNATITQTFDVTVNSVNDLPTLAAISDLAIDEDASEQTVNLAGITAGGGETQPLAVTAVSSNASLIANPTVVYSSAAATGTLKFTPLADQSGSAIITVTVEDGGLDNNLATSGDNATTSHTFDVTVNPINDDPTLNSLVDLTIDENSSQKTVNLTGITAGENEQQPLRVTAVISNASLIANPTVTYTSAESTGTLSFAPLADQSGATTITVTVTDGGLDNDLATTGDNATTSEAFDVVVAVTFPWHNTANPLDINDDGATSSMDALVAINELNSNGSYPLPKPRSATGAPYYDVNRDGQLTPGDSLQIINHLNETDEQVVFSFDITDVNDEILSQVEVGDHFYVSMYAQDTRSTAYGVFAAYLDLYYDTRLVAPVGTPVNTVPFTNFSSASFATAGVVDEWGVMAGLRSTGSGRLLVSTIQFQALAAGTNLFGSDSADIIPAHDVLLYRLYTSVSPSLIQYGSSSLAIVEADNGEGEYSDEGEDFFTRDGLQLLSNDSYLSDELEDTLDLLLGTTSD